MSQETASALDELDQLLKGNSGGYEDKQLLQDVHRHLDVVRRLPGCSMKAIELEGWCAILFSPRKHRRYETPGLSGSDRVRGFVLADLSVLRSLAS